MMIDKGLNMKKMFFSLLFVVSILSINAQSVKPRVGVLDFVANGMSKSEAQTVGEIFTSELVSSGKYDVVDRKNIESLMKEMELQMSGCTDSSCAVEVGQILALDYMMYGSINKLGSSFIINVYMINVETAQIEGTSKERFITIEQSYDVMPVVMGKLIEGDAYSGPTPDFSTGKNTARVKKERPPEGYGKYVEAGIGYMIGDWESGVEFETSYRYMVGDFFGLGGGILIGYSFGRKSSYGDDYDKEPGLKFGLNVEAYFQIIETMGLSIGFKGLPDYTNDLGGPVVGFYFGSSYVRIALDVIGGGGVCLDAGYSFKL